MKKIIPFLCFALFTAGLYAQTSHVTYQETGVDFPNPERGFYRYSAAYSTPYINLDADELRSYRTLQTPSGAQYKAYSTLVYRYFFLSDFTDSPITQEFLDNMQEDFDILRETGLKVIARFAYTETVNSDGCSSWICPPYGDAPKERMLEHVSQLAPVLQANKDVIAVVQMGFIGVWGEGYYTDYFGDASQSPFIINTENWEDRNELLAALLVAVPEERQVQVRYPQIKQRLVYGINAPTSSAALTSAEAHSFSDKARIGHHNDCFLASATDFGTYDDYGPGPSGSDTSALKPYLEEDSRFLAVGGETCASYEPHDDCASAGGMADIELRRFHYSYLHAEYNNAAVNNDWADQGCIGEIKKNLGYRFVLEEGDYSDEARPGDAVSVDINLKNIGYAPTFNARDVELILRDTAQELAYRAKLPDADPRFWESGGTHTVAEAPCLPADMPAGNYELLFNLPDPETSIHDRPEYAIRLANQGTWEWVTGYNHLQHSVNISADAAANACNSSIVFEPLNFVSSTVSIMRQQAWKVFPNPAHGHLTFSNDDPGVRLLNAQMFDLLGRPLAVIFEKQSAGIFSMKLPEVAAGIYFLRLETGDGVVVKRVSVE